MPLHTTHIVFAASLWTSFVGGASLTAHASEAKAGDASLPLLAQAKGGKKKKAPAKPAKDKAKKSAADGGEESSAAASQSHAKFGAAARAGYMYIGAGVGAEGYYILNPNMHIGGQVLYMPPAKREAEGDDALFAEYASFEVMSFGARMRYFFSDSFFVLGGLTYNQVSGQYGVSETATDTLYTTDYSGSVLTADVGLGNLWKLGSSFVLGADWFVLTLPVSVSVSPADEAVSDEDGNPPSLDPFEAEGKTLDDSLSAAVKKSIQFQALMVYAGMTF